jgi:glycosyltransferase involved in cell wall biosynthesis
MTVANHLGARGGLERTQLSMCRSLAQREHRIDLVYVSRGDLAEDWEQITGTMTRIPGTLPRRQSPFRSVVGLLQALGVALRLRPEAIVVYRYWDVPYGALSAILLRTSLVFYLCLPPPTRIPRWLFQSLRRVDRVLAVSEDTASRWEEVGLRAERTSVVLTGIDMSYFVPGSSQSRLVTRQNLGLEPDAFVVLYAGRISREKGIDVLVRACRLVQEEIPDLHLVVVGGPSLGADPSDSQRYVDELHALLADLPVSWLPYRREVCDVIQAADVAVVPSLWPEPLSRSVIEALACGVPVVATKVGGTPEILTDWLSQYLVAPNDPYELAERLRSLHRWREMDVELGTRCRDAVSERFSLEREVDAVETAILELGRRPFRSLRRSARRMRPRPAAPST